MSTWIPQHDEALRQGQDKKGPSPVEEAFDQLGKALGAAHYAADVMERRLAPVLLPAAKTDKAGDPEPAKNPPLDVLRDIHRATEWVQRLEGRIRDVESRLVV